ncbi:MAG: OmpA family protein, partial [Rhodospirillales bacterium]
FNKSDITPEASKIITQAVDTAKKGGSSRVELTGHADRSGPDKYNMALSLKRANAVKATMVKQGIPADQISVVGKGETAPLVQTPDGVREPQNRRVEIVLP